MERKVTIHIHDDRKHDQSFVKIVIEEMLKDTHIEHGSHIVIVSDNCSSRYKSAPHFHNIKQV